MRPENFVPPRVEGTMEHGVIDFDTRTETRTNQVDGKVVYVDIKRGKRGKLYANSISYENWDAEAKRIEKLKKRRTSLMKKSIRQTCGKGIEIIQKLCAR